jgi:hypothetical protein
MSSEQLSFIPCPRWITPLCGPREDLATPVIVWPEKHELVHVLGSPYSLDAKDESPNVRRRLRYFFEELAVLCKGVAMDVRGVLTIYVLDPDPIVEQIVRTQEISRELVDYVRTAYESAAMQLQPTWKVWSATPDVQQVDLSITNKGVKESAWTRAPLHWGAPVLYPSSK